VNLAIFVVSAALLVADEPYVERLLGEPAQGCDVAIAFSFSYRQGDIDRPTYWRVGAWLRKNAAQLSKVEEISWDYEGGRTVCLTAASPAEREQIFQGLRDVLPKRSTRGSVTLQSRSGSRFETKGLGPYDTRRPPRDNGISGRPPLGNRN
jgi:hypothetical protein